MIDVPVQGLRQPIDELRHAEKSPPKGLQDSLICRWSEVSLLPRDPRAATCSWLLEHRAVSSLHFLGCYFLDLVPDQPGVAIWVADAAAAFAIELICGWHQYPGPSSLRLGRYGVRIVDMQVQGTADVAVTCRRIEAKLWKGIRQHQYRRPQLHLRMPDTPRRLGQSEFFHSTEGCRIEPHCGVRIAHSQIGEDFMDSGLLDRHALSPQLDGPTHGSHLRGQGIGDFSACSFYASSTK